LSESADTPAVFRRCAGGAGSVRFGFCGAAGALALVCGRDWRPLPVRALREPAVESQAGGFGRPFSGMRLF
jgi:hypothetical protein